MVHSKTGMYVDDSCSRAKESKDTRPWNREGNVEVCRGGEDPGGGAESGGAVDKRCEEVGGGGGEGRREEDGRQSAGRARLCRRGGEGAMAVQLPRRGRGHSRSAKGKATQRGSAQCRWERSYPSLAFAMSTLGGPCHRPLQVALWLWRGGAGRPAGQ